MKLYFFLLSLALIFPADKIKVWKEKKGVAVVEAEHIQTRNDLPLYWSVSKVVDGYRGTGYLFWEGASYLREEYKDLDEERILEFYVSIQKEGVYCVKVKGLSIDEVQSHMLVRINESDWHKYTFQNGESFSWDVNERKQLSGAFLQLGYHKVEVAAISTGFMLDRFELIHEDDLKGDAVEANLESNSESRSEYLSVDKFKGITN